MRNEVFLFLGDHDLSSRVAGVHTCLRYVDTTDVPQSCGISMHMGDAAILLPLQHKSMAQRL